jgi:D-threo-aldose 1-dehydrogenase
MNNNNPQDSVYNLFAKRGGPLGFGCGWLGLAGQRQAGVRLLDAAFDAGITYFDTARLYADGRAEAALAGAFARRRDQVIITTKAGILPAPNGLAARVRDKLAVIARKAPSLRSAVAAPKVREPVFGVFDLARLRASVEASLRELRTDYVDGLLLHECGPENVVDPDVVGFLHQLKREGKIRAWGVAPNVAQMTAIARSGRPLGAIAQFSNSAFEDNLVGIGPLGGALVITHTSLAGRFRELMDKLRGDDAAARWRKATGMNPGDATAVGRVFLRYALQRNPDGVVLFSTTNPARIADNVRASEKNDAEHAMAEALPAGLKAVGF